MAPRRGAIRLRVAAPELATQTPPVPAAMLRGADPTVSRCTAAAAGRDGVPSPPEPSSSTTAIAPATTTPTAPRTIGRRTAGLGGLAAGLAAGFGALWVINATAGTVTRIDVSDGRVGARHTVWVGNGTTDVAAGAEGVWVTNSSSATAVQLHPRTGAKLRTVRLRGLVGGVALDAGGVWVANPGRGRLVRIDPEGGPTRSIRLGPTSHTADVAAGDGAVFYLDGETGNATRVDPRSRRRVGSPVRVAADPGGAVVAARSLWVTDTGRGTVTRLRF